MNTPLTELETKVADAISHTTPETWLAAWDAIEAAIGEVDPDVLISEATRLVKNHTPALPTPVRQACALKPLLVDAGLMRPTNNVQLPGYAHYTLNDEGQRITE